MELPVFGKNATQSYVDFETATTKIRFGFEGTRLFLEVNETKRYLTGTSGELMTDKIDESTSDAGVTIDGVKLHDGEVTAVTPQVTTPVGTVTVKEYGDGRNMVTELTLTNFIIGHIPADAAALGVGNIVGVFPAGCHIEDSFYQRLVLTLPGTAVNSDTGLGSVIASGAVNVLSGTGTFEDRLTGQTTPTDPTGGTMTAGLVKSPLTGISVNIPTSVKNIFLNSAGTWNVDNHGDLTATGVIIVKWTKMS